MRVSFIIIFLVALLSILFSSMLITYHAVQESQEQFSAELERLSEDNPDLQKSAALFSAFSEKRAIELTRRSIRPYLSVIALVSALFLILLLGITRPLHRLTRAVREFSPERNDRLPLLKEQGTIETRRLIRSTNQFARQISDYYSLIGDSKRFRGWKEISRVIVHEVNNLISPVETYAGFLAEKLEASDSEKAVRILNSLREIKSVLNRLRNLSHLPSAKLEERDLSPVIQSVADEFPQAQFIPPPQNISVLIDEILFKEILRNLIKNAIESGEAITATVATNIEESSVIIKISDNGPGIPTEIRDTLFKPGTTGKPGNLGIGLSIAQSLAVEQKQELVLAESGPEGSVFEIHVTAKEDTV